MLGRVAIPGEAGTRQWTDEPGEYRNSLTALDRRVHGTVVGGTGGDFAAATGGAGRRHWAAGPRGWTLGRGQPAPTQPGAGAGRGTGPPPGQDDWCAHHGWNPQHNTKSIQTDPQLCVRPGKRVLPPGQARPPGHRGTWGSGEEEGHGQGGGTTQGRGHGLPPGLRAREGRTQERTTASLESVILWQSVRIQSTISLQLLDWIVEYYALLSEISLQYSTAYYCTVQCPWLYPNIFLYSWPCAIKSCFSILATNVTSNQQHKVP